MFEFKKKISFDCDELIKTDLTCPICSETYDRSHRLPKLLSRCHTICIKCLEGICAQSESNSKRYFPCPICRRDINIPKGGASAFQTDPYLNRILNRIDSCEITPQCPRHPLEELQYCEPCKALFCDSCGDKSHCNDNLSKPEHSTRRFFTVMKRKSETLTSETDKWISELDDADRRLALIEGKIKEKSDGILEENDLFFTKMSSLLDKRRQEISVSIRETQDKKLKTLGCQRQWIAKEKAKVTTGFKRFKHQGTVSEVEKKTEELHDRAKSKKDCLIPKENCSLRCVDNRELAGTIQRAIEGYIGFRTSKTLPSLCEAKIGHCFARMFTSVIIVTKDFSGEECYENDLDAICVAISDSKNSRTFLKIHDREDGNYVTQFFASKPGTYRLEVLIFDCPIKNHPIEFEARKYENSIYSNDISNIRGRFSKSTFASMECVKLMVNQKEVKIGPRGWTLGIESVLSLRPTHSQLLDTPRIESAASLNCPNAAWMCGENSFWRVSSDREKERATNIFSLASNLCCIELVPSYGLSSQSTEIDSIDAELQTTTCFFKEDIAIDEARSVVTFRHKFENLSRMSNSVFSPPVFARNLSWRVYICINVKQEKTESVQTLGVFLKCDGCPKSSTWSCKAEAEFRLIRQNDDKPLTRKLSQPRVFARDPPGFYSWGFNEFEYWNDVLDPKKGFIKDDTIILEVSMSADTPLGVSEDSMEYTGYLPLNEKASMKASLFTSFPLSGRATMTNTTGRESRSLSNQDSNRMSASSCDTSTTTSTEHAESPNLMASLNQENFSSTSSESTGKRDLGVQSLRTVWIGSDDGILYVLSAEDQSVYSCIKMKVPDSAVQIIHSRGKVFIALANGYCCVFTGSQETQFWNLSAYFLVDINEKCLKDTENTSCTDELASTTSLPDETLEKSISSTVESSMDEQNSGISCMEVVDIFIWLTYQNSIHILDCDTLKIVSEFKVGAEDAQIGKMTATEGGVWCSYRSQSDQMIQLFSAIEPYEKIMSIDIRPDLKKMLIPVLSGSELDSVAKITALKASDGYLWVGTAAGVILCIPYKLTSNPTELKCDLSQAQLSLHGFGGAVKFFLLLKDGMISGGQGYRDLMIDSSAGTNCIFDQNYPYVILWGKNE